MYLEHRAILVEPCPFVGLAFAPVKAIEYDAMVAAQGRVHWVVTVLLVVHQGRAGAHPGVRCRSEPLHGTMQERRLVARAAQYWVLQSQWRKQHIQFL